MANYTIGKRNDNVCAIFQGKTCTIPFSKVALQDKIEEATDEAVQEQYRAALKDILVIEGVVSEVGALLEAKAAIKSRFSNANKTFSVTFSRESVLGAIKALTELLPEIENLTSALKTHQEKVAKTLVKLNRLDIDLEDYVLGVKNLDVLSAEI